MWIVRVNEKFVCLEGLATRRCATRFDSVVDAQNAGMMATSDPFTGHEERMVQWHKARDEKRFELIRLF